MEMKKSKAGFYLKLRRFVIFFKIIFQQVYITIGFLDHQTVFYSLFTEITFTVMPFKFLVLVIVKQLFPTECMILQFR